MGHPIKSEKVMMLEREFKKKMPFKKLFVKNFFLS